MCVCACVCVRECVTNLPMLEDTGSLRPDIIGVPLMEFLDPPLLTLNLLLFYFCYFFFFFFFFFYV